jgi:hypothetical protein
MTPKNNRANIIFPTLVALGSPCRFGSDPGTLFTFRGQRVFGRIKCVLVIPVVYGSDTSTDVCNVLKLK